MPEGVVNQNETSSLGWKPRAMNITVSPTLTTLFELEPFLLPDVSHCGPVGVSVGAGAEGVLVAWGGAGGFGAKYFCLYRNVPS